MRTLAARVTVTALLLTVVLTRSATAQHERAASRVDVGFLIDTDTLKSPTKEIVSAMREYLLHPSYHVQPKGQWRDLVPYDARANNPVSDAMIGYPATIAAIDPVGEGDTLFEVSVLHASWDSVGKFVRPYALQRFDAHKSAREPFGWQLLSPMKRLTASWSSRTDGPLTYWYPRGAQPNRAKARAAAKFVDSIATLFEVAPPIHLDIYVTQSMREMNEVLGVSFLIPLPDLAGRSVRADSVMVLPSARLGEYNRHELVRAVLQPRLGFGNLISWEGIPVWLGSVADLTSGELYSQLVRYQQSHKEWGALATISQFDTADRQLGLNAMFATTGLIMEGIYKHSGMSGVRQFQSYPGNSPFYSIIPALLGIPASELDNWWRAEAAAHSKRP